jgi:hypothetical protein
MEPPEHYPRTNRRARARLLAALGPWVLHLLIGSPAPAQSAADEGEDEGAGETQAVAMAAAKERQLTVHVERIATNGGHLVIDLVLEHLLDPTSEGVLERGIPVTLVCEVEVWRERQTWFDRLEAVRSVSYKLQRDAWDEVYVLRQSGGGTEIFVDIDEARSAIERRTAVTIAPLDLFTDKDAYYLVVNAALKPLTVEDVDELEGWLSGEIKSGREKGFQILGIPKALFGLIKDVTGLGDRNDTLRTPSFKLGEVIAAEIPAG